MIRLYPEQKPGAIKKTGLIRLYLETEEVKEKPKVPEVMPEVIPKVIPEVKPVSLWEIMKQLPKEMAEPYVVEKVGENIKKGTFNFFKSVAKGAATGIVGLGNVFLELYPQKYKEAGRETAKELQEKLAVKDISEIPGRIFEGIAEIAIGAGLIKSALIKVPTIAKFASGFPKTFNALSFGLTGTALGQIKSAEIDATYKDRLKQAAIDFPLWTAWGVAGGVPVKQFYVYLPSYFTIGYLGAKLEGSSQKDALVAGLSTATIGGLLKLAGIPKKTQDILKKQSDTVLRKYGITDDASYKTAMHKYHPDVSKLPEKTATKISSQITSAWTIRTKSPKELERGIMQEFRDLWRAMARPGVPAKRAITIPLPFEAVVPKVEVPPSPIITPAPITPIPPVFKPTPKIVPEAPEGVAKVIPVEIGIKPLKPIPKEAEVKEKLPVIKKPPIKPEGKLYGVIMPDPGLDKFLAEEVRPVLNKATEAGKYLLRTSKGIPNLILKIIEPAKLVKDKGLLAIVTKGTYGRMEARLVKFDQKNLETYDGNISELEKWYNDNFTDKDLRNLMLSRGTPTSAEALTIQRDAIKALPKELKVSAQQKAIQEIADFNYKFLQRVASEDIHKVEDYFYGVYENPKMVSKFLDYWRSTKRFIKLKKFPTVADAEAYGLTLRHKNPVANLRAEFRAIAKLEGMIWMREELLRTGKGIYIEEMNKAPVQWDKINDPVFVGLRVEPDLARLMNNLISTNLITRVPPLNALRKINNFLRTTKFIGSAFHLLSVGKQSIVDSGYLGFAYKKTAIKGATSGFRKNDPIFLSREYLEYVELGGGHKYSIEFEAKRALLDFVNKINRGNYLGAFTKMGIIPAKLPLGFVNWMFNNYIPKVKYAKYLDFVAEKENKLGRMLTDAEKIEIIKEGQNFYGMMNERLFGRSGTVTTALRFVFMSPGYAEGNYRTIIKAFSQWGVKGTYGAGRSRYNIVNSLIFTAMLATTGTLIMTRKWPKKPEKLEDIRDLFKVDTGYVDDKGRKIMIDLMTYDKDYWRIAFNVLQGRPDIAIGESVKRVGGMNAPTFKMLLDFAGMITGNKIYDWKGNEVVELTDPFLVKVQKIALHEIRRLEPISMSVYKQSREKEVDMALAFVISMMGVRLTKTEEEKRTQKIISRIYSLKGQQEELYQYLGTIDNPKKEIEKYNKMVNDVLDSKMVPEAMSEEWRPKLIVDIDRLLSNKVYQLTSPMTTLTDSEKDKEIERIKKYLNNFEVSIEEAREHLKYYWKEHPVKNRWSKTHQENVIGRKVRLRERY